MAKKNRVLLVSANTDRNNTLVLQDLAELDDLRVFLPVDDIKDWDSGLVVTIKLGYMTDAQLAKLGEHEGF